MSISERLNEAKFDRNLSEHQIAELLGASQTTINKWLTGAYLPTRPYWKAIAVFLGMTEDEVAEQVKLEKRLRLSGPTHVDARLEIMEARLETLNDRIERLADMFEKLADTIEKRL